MDVGQLFGVAMCAGAGVPALGQVGGTATWLCNFPDQSVLDRGALDL